MNFFYFVINIYVLLQITKCRIELVIEIIRNGARNNVYNISKWQNNINIDEITSIGERQNFILGANYRIKYLKENTFLSENYNQNEILSLSSGFNRSIVANFANLLGLYPIKRNPNFKLRNSQSFIEEINDIILTEEVNETLSYNLSPFVINEKNDIILKAIRCNGFKLLREENKKNNIILDDIKKKYKHIFNKIGTIMNIKNVNYDYFFQIIDGLQSDIYSDEKIPKEIDHDLWLDIKYLYSLYIPLIYFNSETSVKFSNTLYFEFIINLMKSKILNETTNKFIILSVHDINMWHLLLGFNFTNINCIYQRNSNITDCITDYPTYSSSFIIELHSNISLENKIENYYVNILYNGKKMKYYDKINIDFDIFKSHIKSSVFNIDEFKEICNSEKTITKFIFNLDYTKKLIIYIIAIIETGVLLILCFIFLKMRINKIETQSLRQKFDSTNNIK